MSTHLLPKKTFADYQAQFAHSITKKMLHQEWSMSIDEAIEAQAEAQALCMQTNDFRRAYEAFVNKEKPIFEGD